MMGSALGRSTTSPCRGFARAPRGDAGFSLIEMLVTLTVLALVIGAISTVLIHATVSRLLSSNRFESLQMARAGMDLMTRDLRCAGYGVDADNPAGGQPAIAYVDSMQILVCENQQPYPDTSGAGEPQAYDPHGSPNPKPIAGTQWAPPVKYRTGAEIIRYTLDLNDDGLVDASDIASPQGADAQRTRQPNDYTLVREVYGDHSGGIAGNNGGAPERIALVMKPGGGVPPLFDVYMGGSTTPWDWSNGPVPPSQLANITRVEVHVTSSSQRPDDKGNYTMTHLDSGVKLTRNAPDFGTGTYLVDGWVFQDAQLPLNGLRDTGEPGLAGAVVHLGNGRVAYTSSTGYFSFLVPAGTYKLRHDPPAGFGSFGHPDSFTIDVSSNQTRSFPDTARTGGWVSVRVFDDANGNGSWDVGESGLSGVTVALSPGGAQGITDAHGSASLFAAAGTWALAAAPPTNYSATTANPVSVTMTAGGTATATFGMTHATSGTITGRVFNDRNGDGTYNGTDAGIAGVTVSVMDASGTVTIGTGASASDGTYSITAPQTSGTTTYCVTCPAQAGLYCTTGLSYSGVTVGSGMTVSGKDFGFAQWNRTTITTGAVSCMAVTDIWENDGSGSAPNTRHDQDLIVGYNAAGGPQVSIWCNAYPTTTPFSGSANMDMLWWNTPIPTAVVADSVISLSNPKAPYVVIGFPPYTYGGSNHGYSGYNNTYNWGWDQRSTGGSMPNLFVSAYIAPTSDYGTVNSILAVNLDGGSATDLIIGTAYPAAGRGGFEIWQGQSAGAGTISWAQSELYPAAGSVPGQRMGEVHAMAMGDIDGDGKRDLVVATQTGSTSGAIMIFRRNSTTTNGDGSHGDSFTLKQTITLANDAPTSVAVGDVDGDGRNDIVVGTKASTTTGHVIVYRNTYGTTAWSFSTLQTIGAPGAVLSLAAGDLGGSSDLDVVVGYISSTVNTTGGACVYFGAGSMLNTTANDPTGGNLTRPVTAISLGNFNYGTSPSMPAAPYLTDIALGWKQSTTSGGVTVLVR